MADRTGRSLVNGATSAKRHEMNTIAHAFVSALGRCPDQVAFQEGERTYSYSETSELMARMIRVFSARGTLVGKGLGVLALNRADGFMAAVGIQVAGGFFVALPNRSSAVEIAEIIDDAQLALLLVDPELEELGAAALELAAVEPEVFTLGPCELGRDLLAAAEDVGATRLSAAPEVSWDLDAHIMFTGGTTGKPKGVVHRQHAGLAMALRPLWAYEMPSKPRSLAIAPMTHSGYQIPLATIMAGGTVIVVPKFAPDLFVDVVEREHITATIGVPTMIYAVMDYAETHQTDLSSLRNWLYAAAPISPDRLVEAQRRWGSIFVQAYAMSESYGHGTVLHSDEHDLSRPERLASCGRATAETLLRVADDEGNAVTTGEVGEILMRGPNLMTRYLNLPDLTEEVCQGRLAPHGRPRDARR